MVIFKDEAFDSPRKDEFRLPGAFFKEPTDYEMGAAAFMHKTLLGHIHKNSTLVTWSKGFGPVPHAGHSGANLDDTSVAKTRRHRRLETQKRFDQLLRELFEHPNELYKVPLCIPMAADAH